MKEIFLFLLLISLIFQASYTEEVIGCGGFIKSDTEINLKIIKVKLMTKDGALKYTTEASPVNGYYMIPVYAKGEYILQVSPPPGWSFEPGQVLVNIDGENDACSRNEDINFFFKGFGLSGKVVSQGDIKNRGSAGVKLNLISDDKIIDSTVSGMDGAYYFSNVMPGKYQVEASDSSFRFKTSKVKVELSKENWFAKDNIVVSGYKIEGSVLTQDQAGIQNAVVELRFQEDGQNVDTKNFECDHSVKKGDIICSVKTDQNGKFFFGNVMHDKYNLVAKYSINNLQLFMRPDLLQVDLTKHSNLKLKDNFILNSLSIRGKILASKNKPLELAEVFLNGKKIVSNKNGEFLIENLSNGNYKVSIKAKNIYYEDRVINIDLSSQKILQSSNLLNLAEIFPKSFDVCGKVGIKNSDLLSNLAESIKIKCFLDNKLFKTVSLEKDLKYCMALDINTNYVLKAELSEKLSQVLRLVPQERKILLTDGPLFDANFEQLEAKLEGSIEFLPNEQVPNDFGVTIKSSDSTWKQNIPIKCSRDNKDKPLVAQCSFVLNNLLFGNYQLSTNYDDLYCWQMQDNQQTLSINVNSELQKISIQQQGFKLRYKLSHKNLVLTLMDREKNILYSRNVIKNSDLSDEICLPKKADYTIRVDSSHRFTDAKSDQDNINLKSDIFKKGSNQINLNAFKHKVTVDVIYQFNDDKDKLAVNKNDLRVLVKRQDQLIETINLEQKTELKNQIVFSGKTWLAPKLSYTFTADSEKVLFESNDKQIEINEDNCELNSLKFDSILGIFITGKVKASDLDSIDLVLKSALDNSILKKIQISNGFKLGPLKAPYSIYTVDLSKPGYEFSILNSEIKEGNYNLDYQAVKLGQLKVNIVDAKTKTNLENVLLSLSSENRQFRQTIRTDSSGLASFDNLKPGLYYLLMMMQEYEFTPNSHPIQITDGFNSNLLVQANRVAFSVFGKVTSINGQAETGVTVEANGVRRSEDESEAENEICRSSRENAQVDENHGTYRIRNLRPGCIYELKIQTKTNNRELRIMPDKFDLNMSQEDVFDKNFVLVDQMDKMDISVGFNYKLNELVSIKSRKKNNFVRVSLFKTNEPNQILQSVYSPANSIVYLNAVNRDNTQYSLTIELLFPSTISVFGTLTQNQINQMQQLPVLDHKEISFNTDKSHRHFNFEFKTEQRLNNEDILNMGQEKYQNVYLTLPFFIILIFLVLNWTKVQGYLMNLNGRILEKGSLINVLQKSGSEQSSSQSKVKFKARKSKDTGSDNETIQRVSKIKASQVNDGSSEQSDGENSGLKTIEDGDLLVLHTRKQKVKKAL